MPRIIHLERSGKPGLSLVVWPILLLLGFRIFGSQGTQTVKPFPELKGDYLGQPLPGAEPLLFASGIVSTECNELNAVFTCDGNEFYFTRQDPGSNRYEMKVMIRRGGIWSEPVTCNFSGAYDDADPYLSPDCSRMYFISKRPLREDGSGPKDMDIWMVERAGGRWSRALPLGLPINTSADEIYPAVTAREFLFFTADLPGGLGESDIYRSSRSSGGYSAPVNLGPPINSKHREGDIYVSPDESYLILSAHRPDGFGAGDLYLSRKTPQGFWSDPENLGREINTPEHEYCPMVTPDGRYLFFSRKRGGAGDVYWVALAPVLERVQVVSPASDKAP